MRSMSPSPSSNRTCGFPASGSPINHRRMALGEPSIMVLQEFQPQILEISTIGLILRNLEASLAAASKMVKHPLPQEVTDRAKGLSRITEVEILLPTTHMGIYFIDEDRDRDMTSLPTRHFAEHIPFASQGFLRWHDVQVAMLTAMEVSVE